MRPIPISPSPKLAEEMSLFRGTRGLLFQKESPSLKKDRPLSPIKELSRPGSAHVRDLPPQEQNLSSTSLQTVQVSDDEPAQRKKRYELLPFGGAGDVFQRLAHAHTQASQAKVIQRSNVVDKEALMMDPAIPGVEQAARKKSLTEMEHAWNE